MADYPTPTLSTLISRIENDLNGHLPGEGAKLKRTFLYVLARVLAGASFGLYGFVRWTRKQTIYDTIDDIDTLTRIAGVWGLTRLAGTQATGSVGFTGTPTTGVPAGTLVQSASGVEYATDALVTTDGGGSATATVTAVLPGDDGNVADVTETLELVEPIAGIRSTVTLVTVLSGGSAQEVLEDLRVRLLERVRDTPQGGADADYVAWTKAATGLAATVANVWPETGPFDGDVTVYFSSAGDGAATIPVPGDVALVQAYIDEEDAAGYPFRRPITANVTVVAPTAYPVDFSISISPNNATVQAAIAAELETMFETEATPGGVIRNSKVHEAINRAAGVAFYTLDDVDGGGGGGNIISDPAELAHLEDIVFVPA